VEAADPDFTGFTFLCSALGIFFGDVGVAVDIAAAGTGAETAGAVTGAAVGVALCVFNDLKPK
jgi:hypothetical protein